MSTCDCLSVAPERLEPPLGGQSGITMCYDPSGDQGEVRIRAIVRSEEGGSAGRGVFEVVGRVARAELGGSGAVMAPAPAVPPAMEPPAAADQELQLSFEFFFDPDCKACETFIRGKVWLWQEELGARIEAERRDLSHPGIVGLYERRLEEIGAEERAYPAALFDGVLLQGYEEIRRELKGLLQRSLAGKR
ncbi:MAG: hypothetical protein JW820_20670 [Spirochaetales bacterium]|nr:hypothetical protein [Spirochaetales bacterium]